MLSLLVKQASWLEHCMSLASTSRRIRSTGLLGWRISPLKSSSETRETRYAQTVPAPYETNGTNLPGCVAPFIVGEGA